MTRQHFELIAKVVSTIDNEDTRKETALNFANELQHLNPRFRIDFFLKACNP
jgi:hypothetical protein